MNIDDAVIYLAGPARGAYAGNNPVDQGHPWIGVEVEHPQLDEQHNPVPQELYMNVPQRIADDDSRTYAEAVYDELAHDKRVKGTVFTDAAPLAQGSGVNPEFDYDSGPQAEIGTEKLTTIEDAIWQVDQVEQFVLDYLRQGEGCLYRQALTPALMTKEGYGPIQWDADFDEEGRDQYTTPVSRYAAGIEFWHGGYNAPLENTGSIQTTGTPDINGDIDTEVPRAFATLQAASPFIYGPFMTGAVFGDDGIEAYNGREKAYERTMLTPDLMPEDESADRFGYDRSVHDHDSIEDLIESVLDIRPEYISVPSADIQYEEVPFDEDDAFGQITPETAVPFIPLQQDGQVYRGVSMKQLIEDQKASGVVRAPDNTGTMREQRATWDVSYLSNDQFAEQYLDDLFEQAGGFQYNGVRAKPQIGVFELRDVDNTQYMTAAVAAMNGALANWEQIDAVCEDYGLEPEDFQEIRTGVNEHGPTYSWDDEVPVTEIINDISPLLVDGARQRSRTNGPAHRLRHHLDHVTETGRVPADDTYDAYANGSRAFEQAIESSRVAPVYRAIAVR